MKESKFQLLELWVTVLGSVLTLGHLAYAAWAHHNSSIIQFIAREWW